MFEWPPNWFFGIVSFLAASAAVRGWRDLLQLVLIAALSFFPIKWIGPTLSFPALGANAVSYEFSDAGWYVHAESSAAVVASIILASIVMLLRKHMAARAQARAGEGRP